MVTRLTAEQLEPFLIPILSPLVPLLKIVLPKKKFVFIPFSSLLSFFENHPHHLPHRVERAMYNQTREMAEELNRMIKKRIGAAAYLALFQELSQKAAKKREERKKKQNMSLILDPQLAARQKIKRNAKKREKRKRKVEELRPMRPRIKVRKISTD